MQKRPSCKLTSLIRLCCFGICFFSMQAFAQAPIVFNPGAGNSGSDTIRIIQIIRANTLREIFIDSATVLQTIAGQVELREGGTLFTCDSATINKRTNVLEAFGNVHINQRDSIHTYAQYLKYVGADRVAYLKKKVRLTDKKGTLFTDDLTYDLKTSIGNYSGGGQVVNGKTRLTSREGTYYADTRDVFFKRDVVLNDPKYTIRSDSLRYNTGTQQVDFITGTYVKSSEGVQIYTTSGNYDLKNGKAFFGNRTVFKDSTRTFTADRSAIDEASGIAQLEGNAVIRDSVNGYTVMGNQLFLDRNKNTFLATRKPVLIFKGEGNDSTFVAADTLFSGLSSFEKGAPPLRQDTLNGFMVLDSVGAGQNAIPDSSLVAVKQEKQPGNSPSVISKKKKGNKGHPKSGSEDAGGTRTNPADSTYRYFLAFHHVRIYNDSLQAVCDSLHYSGADSTFRLFRDPVVFSNRSQIAGDTIYLHTRNKKADRVAVFDRGILVNKINDKCYNQVSGRKLNGYFKNGELDYMRVRGVPAESIFYPQDEDSAFIGLNRCHGDQIDILFRNRDVHRIKLVNQVEGTLYPIDQIPEGQRFLKGFIWQEERRPKSRFALFE